MASAVTAPSPVHVGSSPHGTDFSSVAVKEFKKINLEDPSKCKNKNNDCKPSPNQNSQNQKNKKQLKSFHGKRRHSFGSSGPENKPFKRKRNMIIPPTKFLLGGNINDPLNLKSLDDEEVNRQVNKSTPYSSPLPTPKHRSQVEVMIPPNINDPLNLNTGEDIDFGLTSPKSKKRKKNRSRKRKDSASMDLSGTDEGEMMKSVEISTDTSILNVSVTEEKPPVPKTEEKTVDKIVSPVLAQGNPKHFSRCLSKEGDGNKSKHSGKKKFQQPKPPKFKEKNARFKYGNYNRYYGYRNSATEDDARLQCMKGDWFRGKDVLDIGCNVGHLTLSIARDLEPKKIIGLDIDEFLIKAARKNVRYYLTSDVANNAEFPISMVICHGPVAAAVLPSRQERQEPAIFPNNVFFVQGNYVLDSEEFLETQIPEFDTILCLSLTKWVHLNWGDQGLKLLFKRMFLQLRPGGRLILEAQPWVSYGKKKKLTETIFKNYCNIKLRPEKFNEYLLSREVGFSTCELIDIPAHESKGFRRAIYLFTKADSATPPQVNKSE